MRFLYGIGIRLYNGLLLFASLFNKKANLLVTGRIDSIKRLKELITLDQNRNQHKTVWFHFASLGEFEQGRPVLENFRRAYPGWRCFITFYSPSGYEIRKNTDLSDEVFYLPSDLPHHSRLIFDAFRPDLVIFTKYEYWYNYFNEAYRRKTPLYMISAIFREDQVYFKAYGGFFKSILTKVRHFFVQNEKSIHLLESIGLKNATLTGDTRFDRVINLPNSENLLLPELDYFLGNSSILVAGSTWLTDEQQLAEAVEKLPDWKYILVPHEVNTVRIEEIRQLFPHSICLSSMQSSTKNISPSELQKANVLIVDTIGLLSRIYRYGHVAYIGGGFGAGIHNTLEAATYGIPVVFGPKYQKFQEAVDLISIGAAFSYERNQDLVEWIKRMQNKLNQSIAGQNSKKYVENSAGATEKILAKLSNDLFGQK